MSNDSNKSSGGGTGVLGLLGIAFVVLKLCHVIDWSWWWVTSPFWGGLALILIIFVSGALAVLLAALLRKAVAGMEAQGAAIASWFRNRRNK